MRAHRLLFAAVVAVLVAGIVEAPAEAAGATPSRLVTSAPASGPVGSDVTVATTLTDATSDQPVPASPVRLEHLVAGNWTPVGTLTTDVNGQAHADVEVAERAADNSYRTAWDGNATYAAAVSNPITVQPVKRRTTLKISGPTRITDEKRVRLAVRWRAANGQPVDATVTVRRKRTGTWSTYRTLKLGSDGKASFKVGPRVDTRWQAVGKAGPWFLGDTSNVHSLDNVPPGKIVVLPAAAPKPRLHLPPQKRALGSGPNASVHRIPGSVWRTMVGRTWHSGCPVGRSGLRLVRINYWGYDGYRHRGELVVSARVTGKVVNAFKAMYRGAFPIRSMYRPDRFGWSKRLHGANDYKSMRSGNTSAFNCRGVVNNAGVLSPHASGRAIDLNTWENPYRSRKGLVPNAWWMGHSNPRYAWRSRSHPVVRLFARARLRWTYGLGDTQHFDA